MARGFIVSSQSRATSYFILSAIHKPSSLNPLRTSAFSAKYLRFSSSTPSAGRLFCGCSYGQHDPVDMSRYREAFAKRMAMAGLKPHYRIAIGVSGGPDSVALCLLAANWKNSGINAGGGEGSGFIDGLLAIIVDHGLRAESREEANIVGRRVQKMGIRCEIAHCEWSNGRPKKGHLQEAARERRYQIFQNVCIQHQIGVLLIAHHADDQAELFILRLSRNSGVLGLAGMAFISQLFSTNPYFNDKAPCNPGILLVRPLLEFSKEDMYMICKGSNQEWVEDPTNLSSMFARNRIRMALRRFSSSIFNSELQQVISACRTTRMYVDQVCSNLINQSVTIMAQGYAVIDLESLKPLKVKDICLSKFISLVLQYISQRHKPVRGSVLKLLLDYFHTFPCKTSFTAAGCYLCPAPASRGTKVLVCCFVNSSSALKIDLLQKLSCEGESKLFLSELVQIVVDGKSFSDHSIIDASKFQFLDVTSSESVLVEARTLNILSELTYRSILSLQKDEIEHFRSKTEENSDSEINNEVEYTEASVSTSLEPGRYVYFMNRFLIKWEQREKIAFDTTFMETKHFYCSSCLVADNEETKVRHMIDADWLYLAKLSLGHNVENSEGQRVKFIDDMEQMKGKSCVCSKYAQKSAQRALVLLKSIPVAARRGLPVLVNASGLLLSIPSVGFNHCPCLTGSAVFMPKVPLGGGYSSFV